ncbi:MAG: hypothetical protein WC708_02995 [Lentisphaeria bacterium]
MRFPEPVMKSQFRRIFLPKPAKYLGRSGAELEYGKSYSEWVPNDHGFAFDHDGFCHIFGITHPLTSCERIHDGEEQLFHAKAPVGAILSGGEFADCGNILPPEARPGEPPEIHSPFIIEKDGSYWMVYGPHSFRAAESTDLENWRLRGEWFHDEEGGSRDPQVLFHGGKWILSYCSENEVRCRIAQDCATWSDFKILRAMPAGVSPESPFLFVREGAFYLAVCTWDGVWDRTQVSGAYQSRTLVFAAESLPELATAPLLCELQAHAPEFLQLDGRWFMSSAEYPQRGINIAELEWIE